MNFCEFFPVTGRRAGRGVLAVLLAMLVTVAGTVHLAAQTTVTGGVRGFIYEIDAPLDAKGRPPGVPNAVVTISVPNGVARSTVTNAAGEYFFANLLPNTYTIAARCDGFVPDSRRPSLSTNSQVEVYLTRETIVEAPWIGLLRATTASAVPNAVAAPAGASPNQLLSTSGGARSGSIDRRLLEALPLGGVRSFDAFALLFPGVAPPPQAVGNTTGPGVGAGIGTSGQFSVNGLRSRANNFTVDGSDNNDEDIGVRRQGFTSLVSQPIESVQEFHLTTLLAESQFGRNLGGQVNAVSRSGDRTFHGSAYGFFTDRRLIARDPFDLTGGPANFPIVRAADGRAVQIAEQNQFFQIVNRRPLAPENPVGGENAFTRGQAGFVLGGPVGSDPATFFLSFEHQKVNANRESNFAVPTAAQRGLFGTGDSGFLTNQSTTGIRALYPTSFLGDVFYSLYPFPNNPRGPYGTNTFTQMLPARARGDVFSLRLDRPLDLLGKAGTLAARYNLTDDDTTLPVTGEALFSSVRPLIRTQNLSLFWNAALRPDLANEVRFSFGRTRLDFAEVRNPLLLPSRLFPDVPFLLNRPLLGNASVPNRVTGQPGEPLLITYFTPTARETESGTGPLGQMLVSGFSPVGVDVFNLPQARVNNTFQVADTAIFTTGRHQVTFGADVRRTQLNSRLDRNFLPQVVFNGAPNQGQFTIGDNAALAPRFLTGTDFIATRTPTGFFQVQSQAADSRIGLRLWQIDLFAFDRFRVSDQFTLTFGLRYERNTVPVDSDRRIERTFDSPDVAAFIAAERARPGGQSGLAGFLAGRTDIYSGDGNNFAPQVGFAWQPGRSGRWVVRGGYGVNFDIIPGAVISQSRNVFPSFLSVNLPAFEQFDDFLNAVVLGFANPASFAAPGTLNGYDRGRFPNPVAYLTDPVTGLPSAGGVAGPAFTLPNAQLRTPYSQQFNLTVERAFGRNVLVTGAYVGTRGTKLLRLATPNLGPNAIPVISGFAGTPFNVFFDPLFSGSITPVNRPFPLLGSFTSIESDANSTFHSLQLTGSKRFANGWMLASAYTWSHAFDDVSDLFRLGGADALPQNSFDRRAERGSANFDVRHRFVSHAVWELPFSGRWLGGWRVAGIATFQSGQPFTVTAPYDVNLDGNLTDRPDSTAGVRVVNQGAVRLSTTGQFESLLAVVGSNGRVGRNVFRGPGLASVDFAVTKTFAFDDRRRLTLRAELFNAFNRANYGLPVRQLGFPGFGTSVDTRVSPRTVQFGVRFDF